MQPALPPNDTRLNTRFFLRWREVGADGTGKMHYPAQKQSIQDCKSMKPPPTDPSIAKYRTQSIFDAETPEGATPRVVGRIDDNRLQWLHQLGQNESN